MQAQLQLPQAFYDSLHEVVPSTRHEQEEAALVAVIHDVRYESEFDSSSVSSVSACLGPQLMREQANVLVDIVRRSTIRVDEIEDSPADRSRSRQPA